LNVADFIIETDLGHDPDDLFCICHLVEAGHNVLAMGLVPGCRGQVTLACGLRELFGLDYEIGIQKDAAKDEKLGIHDDLACYYGFSIQHSYADGLSQDVFRRALTKNPDADLLIIGPAPGLGKVADLARGKMTFQGGFLPYSLHRPSNPLPQFEGKEYVPTFNFNGDRKAVDALQTAPLALRRYCGKNVCHGVVLDRKRAEGLSEPKNSAGEVYTRAVKLYLERHEAKKMHDPTALACHLHPEIATWFRGRPMRNSHGWTTFPYCDGDYVLADVDHERLWDVILNRRS
jgi:hypothetical protein